MFSRKRKSDIPAWADHGDWRPRQELTSILEQVEYALHDSFPNFRKDHSSISFDHRLGRTTIFAMPVDFTTPDGHHLLDRLVVRTVLPSELDDWDESTLVTLNILASLGALVIDPHTGERTMVSSVTFLEGEDERMMSIYNNLVVWAAYFHVNSMFSVERSCGDEADEPSHWNVEDFQPAAEMLNQAGYFSNAGSTGLTSEFPWEDGAVSWVDDGVTSLMTFEADFHHPHLGNGLFFKLELPDSYNVDQLVELANHLNVLELRGADVPPFFGAWCSKIDSGRIAYVGFVPNMAYWPGSVGNIASWLCLRAQNSRAAIGNYLYERENVRASRTTLRGLGEKILRFVSRQPAPDIAEMFVKSAGGRPSKTHAEKDRH